MNSDAINTSAIILHITNWLKTYCKKAHSRGFVVGVSGGIDSAVTSTLVARTGLPVLCLEMPIHQAENQDSRAHRHIDQLQHQFGNVRSIRVDLSPVFDSFVSSLPSSDNDDKQFLSLANSRARLRMTTLYYFASLHGYLVAGTGNKVEDFGVGFYTKYGDGGVDLSPIADLMKSEVYALAAAMEIIDEIREAPPTDGLWGDNRSDEDQIGASYPELEWAMEYEPSAGKELSAREKEVLSIYTAFNHANQHKMQPIPVCEIPDSIKFGS